MSPKMSPQHGPPLHMIHVQVDKMGQEQHAGIFTDPEKGLSNPMKCHAPDSPNQRHDQDIQQRHLLL
jgi:hypothetical protein